MSTGFTLPRLDEGAAEHMSDLRREIDLVEQELREQVRSQVRLVSDVGSHVLDAGGKRLRPAFVCLAARATGRPFDPYRARKLGACMEMIHMATLVHDDVIDHAATRRGRSTANAVFGNTASILSGDVLLSKAMKLLAQDGDIQIIRNVSAAVVELAEGEVLELETRGRFDLTEQEHREILRMKTASFIQSCCEVGALVAGGDETETDSLGRYGHHIGLAFQIVDDLLDYRGDTAKTGKPLGTDFREGCATLPLICLSSNLSIEERELANDKFGNGVTDEEITMICRWMDERGAFRSAEEAAREEVRLALEAIAKLPEGPDRRLLETVGEFVLARQS